MRPSQNRATIVELACFRGGFSVDRDHDLNSVMRVGRDDDVSVPDRQEPAIPEVPARRHGRSRRFGGAVRLSLVFQHYHRFFGDSVASLFNKISRPVQELRLPRAIVDSPVTVTV